MNGSIGHQMKVAGTLLRTGVVRPIRPSRAIRALDALHRWGRSLASGYITGAIRYPDRPAIVDERGTLTFSEVDARSNALANALANAGIGEGDGVALMCRNHRGFIDAIVAVVKLGADALFLNTEFGAPAITDVLARERTTALIYDEEFTPLIAEGAKGLTRLVAFHQPGTMPDDTPIEELIWKGDARPLSPPQQRGRVVILTSGTTGTPKGALRRPPDSVEPAAAVLSTIPLRALETTMIAAPLFHSWGFAHLMLSLPLSSTLVLRRRFDPEQTLKAVAEHEASALIVVPVMLQRMLELPEKTLARYDVSSLRVIASSGSALPGELANRVMDRFGDVLYNLYGSTEVAWATIANPSDLRAAPGTAGRPPMGTIVKLLDEGGHEVPQGERGRIFTANSFVFEGYTDGGGKEVIKGLTHTGDVGHLDEEGRLFVDGRDDEMIVSGGENVYPREVEDLIATHEAVEEVAVIGVEDSQFGQRLSAFVVAREGTAPTEDDIKEFVRQNLARFKVPREVVFLEELPRNASGKVLKRALDER